MGQLQFDYAFHGKRVTVPELERFVGHVFAQNDCAEEAGRPKSPVCVWGTHGIGKTAAVQRIAEDLGYQLVYVAPAQFEEMGDLLGMPRAAEDGTTRFYPPEWVPDPDAPKGVLLLDDVNRADIRILRGIMQLLQRYELQSWRLPPRWQIVMTANPDGGDYSVTTMDGAMLTRMLHVTMTFDVRAWAAWAAAAGVDERGINFVLAYPELIRGRRTTPRTLVQFFEQIKPIAKLDAEHALVAALAEACLDGEAAAAFRAFARDRFSKLITPAELLAAKDFEKVVAAPLRELVGLDGSRLDVLAVLGTRLVQHLALNKGELRGKKADRALQNVTTLLGLEIVPNDLRLVWAQSLVDLGGPMARLAADPVIGRLLLERM